jgi:hypothetical protein
MNCGYARYYPYMYLKTLGKTMHYQPVTPAKFWTRHRLDQPTCYSIEKLSERHYSFRDLRFPAKVVSHIINTYFLWVADFSAVTLYSLVCEHQRYRGTLVTTTASQTADHKALFPCCENLRSHTHCPVPTPVFSSMQCFLGVKTELTLNC